jgi:hypothetical protein
MTDTLDRGLNSFIQVRKDDWDELNRALRYLYSRLGAGVGQPTSRAPRVTQRPSTLTLVPNADTTDLVVLTSQSSAVLISNPLGTPAIGQRLAMQFVDNGTPQKLTWGSTDGGYIAQTIPLPAITVASTYLNLDFIWVPAAKRWLLIDSDA